MQQLLTLEQPEGGELRPLDHAGLCLLSLDGGGVRGLSTLFILRGIMTRLNDERKISGLPAVKPCELFDLIGRLEMDVDECISAYSDLMNAVFGEKSSWLPIGFTGRIKAQFDSQKLRGAIEQVILRRGLSKTELFNAGQHRGCKVFVCATAKETGDISRLRSYDLPGKPNISATICEAALATSAATRFFDPVYIGARQFVDGALGANNPIDEVEGEASNIWCSETGDLKPLVKCIVSIGTGHPGNKGVEDDLPKFLSNTLVGIATETERTESRFIARWRQHFDSKRYFRFNVEHGLRDVHLAEYKEKGKIDAATDSYLNHQAQEFRVRDCVLNLKQKQCKAESIVANAIHVRALVSLSSLF
ncbi:hypothetical protein DL770_010141 [Monosporascus sp. CRB-9-2]|nr:hypothetical protein DL770_010141 [Monosporascus sp. CRB-9-2]